MTKSVNILAATAVFATFLSAQPTAPANPIYASTITYHVPDETRGAYEAWAKDKTRRMMEGLMKEDPAIQLVLLTRLIYGGTREPEANYHLTILTQGVPKNRAALQNQVSQKLFGKPYSEVIREAFPLRKRLGQTLARQWAGTPMNLAEGDLIRIDRKKVTPGRMGDYLQTEQQLQKLREAQVADGKMKSWSSWSLVLPAGTDREFDAFTSHVSKDLEGTLNWNQGSLAIGNKLSPPVNGTALSVRAADLAKTVRGDTRMVVMIIKRP